MITIYHYAEDTGVYIGSGVASPNPKDPENPLIPAHSTTTPPSGVGCTFNTDINDWEIKGAAKVKPVTVKVVRKAEDVPVKEETPAPEAKTPTKTTRRRRRKK